jgi:hypothetical protein
MKTSMKQKKGKRTIIQQSYNNRSKMKHNNETRKLNPTMKKNIETQQRKTTDRITTKKSMRHKNVKTNVQQSYYNRSTMKNQ